MQESEIRRLYTRTVSNEVRPLSVLLESFLDACSQWESIICEGKNESFLSGKCTGDEESSDFSEVVRRVRAVASQVRCIQHEVSTKFTSSFVSSTLPSTPSLPFSSPLSSSSNLFDRPGGRKEAISALHADDKVFFCGLNSSPNDNDDVQSVLLLRLARNVCVFSMWLAIVLGDFDWLTVSISSAENLFNLMKMNKMKGGVFLPTAKSESVSNMRSLAFDGRSVTCIFFGHCNGKKEEIRQLCNDRDVVEVIILWYQCFVGELVGAEKLFFEKKKQVLCRTPRERATYEFPLHVALSILVGDLHRMFCCGVKEDALLLSSSISFSSTGEGPHAAPREMKKEEKHERGFSHSDCKQLSGGLNERRKSALPFQLFLRLMAEFIVRRQLVQMEVGKAFRPILTEMEETELEGGQSQNSFNILSKKVHSRCLFSHLLSEESKFENQAERLASAIQVLFFKQEGSVWPFPSNLLNSIFRLR